MTVSSSAFSVIDGGKVQSGASSAEFVSSGKRKGRKVASGLSGAYVGMKNIESSRASWYAFRKSSVKQMTVTAKDYIDSKTEATRAQNDARFAEVLAELRVIREKSISRLEMWLAVVALAGVIIGALSYGSSQFGLGASISPTLVSMQEKQSQTDAAQDAKLDLIIKSLDGISKKIDGAN